MSAAHSPVFMLPFEKSKPIWRVGPNIETVTRVYLKSAAALLLFTAAGKMITILSGVSILTRPAPIFGLISNRSLLLVAAGIEILVGLVAVNRKLRRTTALKSMLALAVIFTAYRLSLWVVGFRGYCECLGWFGDVLHLGHEQTNFLAEGILVYLLAGSYGLLLFQHSAGALAIQARQQNLP